jgi:hypothetical protein
MDVSKWKQFGAVYDENENEVNIFAVIKSLHSKLAEVERISKVRGQMLTDYRAVQVAVMNAMPSFTSDTVIEAFAALIADRDKAQAEVQRLLYLLKAGGETLANREAQIQQDHEDWMALREENRRLKEALTFYARREHVGGFASYIDGATGRRVTIDAVREDGAKAREALAREAQSS